VLPSPPLQTSIDPSVRRLASAAFGLALAFAALKLAGCSGPLNPGPPNPHDNVDTLNGSLDVDPPDASGDAP
jgi:hypothetical protein